METFRNIHNEALTFTADFLPAAFGHTYLFRSGWRPEVGDVVEHVGASQQFRVIEIHGDVIEFNRVKTG